MYVKADQ